VNRQTIEENARQTLRLAAAAQSLAEDRAFQAALESRKAGVEEQRDRQARPARQ
jgi:hypothetical protein